MMSKERRQIEKSDLIPADIYIKSRKQIRKELVSFKKNRRIALGPYATFYFESFETMLAQVQEMLYIEKGGGIEEKRFMKIDNENIIAVPEHDVDRTSIEGKASSVQFIHFKLNDNQIEKFKSGNSSIEIGINHNEYSHATKLTKDNVSSLSADFI